MLFRLGKYHYCPARKFLFLAQQEIPLEPKMAEVLDYLLQHSQRYVPIQELHDRVWTGRIVTDTAVRRVISRLRAQLDDSAEQPQILLSLPKRGYRLVVEAQEILPDMPVLNSISGGISGGQAAPIAMSAGKMQPFLSKRLIGIWGGFLLLMVILGLVLMYPKSETGPAALTVASSMQLPENSRVIALSADGTKLLYQLNRGAQRQYDIFIFHTGMQTSQLLATSSQFVNYGIFVEHDQALLLTFRDLGRETGRAELWQLNGNEAVTDKRILLSQLESAIYPVAFVEPQTALVSVADRQNPEQHVYQRLHWDAQGAGRLEPFLDSSSFYRLDAAGSLSPDGQLFAYQRNSRPESDSEIQIVSVPERRLLYRLPYSVSIRDTLWLDSDVLLVLDEQHLKAYRCSTGHWTTLLDNPSGALRRLIRSGSDIMLVERHATVRRIIELTPSVEKPAHSMVLRPADYQQLQYRQQHQDHMLEVRRTQQSFQLDLRHGDQPQTLLQTEDEIGIVDQAVDGRILLQLGKRLALFNPATNENLYLTSEQSFTENAAFMHQDSGILFGQFSNGHWQIHQFDLSKRLHKPVLTGFRAVKATTDGYVLADPNGHLFHADQHLKQIKPLPVQVITLAVESWAVAGSHVYWLVEGEKGLQLRRFHIGTQQTETIPVAAEIAFLWLSVRADEHRVMLESTLTYQSRLLTVTADITEKLR